MPNPPRKITAHGRTLTLAEWAAETGLHPKTITSRLDVLNWPPERALSARADGRFRRGGRPRSDAPRPCPKLRRDGRGRAFVRWRAFGRNNHLALGAWGSDDAAAGYRRFAAEWAAGVYEARRQADAAGGLGVGELVIRFVTHADREYRKGGRRTSEYHVCNAALTTLNELYGDTPAADFAPAGLRAVRDQWIAAEKSRKTVNEYTARIVRVFAWAVGQSLIPPAVAAALAEVESVKAGRTAAVESVKTRPVSDADVEATVAKLPDTARGRVVEAMVRVQRLAGLRPQHLAEMRVCDLDTRGEVWRYVPPPAGTKTLHLDKRPTFFLGSRAQAAILPHLEGKTGEAHVFDYLMGNGKRKRVTVARYRITIGNAAKLAGVPHWHPHQLRHALATAVAERFRSLDHAAAALGDNAATAEAVYVHVDPQERARVEIARAMG